VGHPAVLVTYRFNGFLDDIYAALVVRLRHSRPFEQHQLWRYAADFKTLTGKPLGVKLTRRAEGEGELEVYFDPAIPIEEKIIFGRYVHEHLMQSAKDVVRLRHYVCPHCGTPVGNREVAMTRLQEGKKDIACVKCDDPKRRVPLWDQLGAVCQPKNNSTGARTPGEVLDRVGQRKQGASAGRRGDFNCGAGWSVVPGVQCE
jgi:hypothetical protein